MSKSSKSSKSEIVYHLEELINTGNKVILYDYDDRELLNLFCEGVAKRELFNIEIWYRACEARGAGEVHKADETHYDDAADEMVGYSFLKPISSDFMNEILDLYRLYDFSDRITVISESTQYGSLFNYVRNGILTPAEMVDAILCKM